MAPCNWEGRKRPNQLQLTCQMTMTVSARKDAVNVAVGLASIWA